jgi:mannose-6-phosphate isomerase-like protein (cupin superfamily)
MKKDIKTLRQYARLRKLPEAIQLGSIDEQFIQDCLQVLPATPVSNERASENREGIYGVEHDNTTPLGKTYNQRHIDDSIPGIECLKEYINTYEWRFAELQPQASIPEHLDDPYSYRFIVMLEGTHDFVANNKTTVMSKGQVWFVNSAYHHSVYNKENNTRIAILGKMNVNDHNTRLLRTRT